MRMFISVLILAMVALPASAKSKAKRVAHKAKAKVYAPSAFTGKLLSYQALVRLPKAKRMKYMRDVMDLLSTMESFNNKYTVAERNRMREFRDQVAQLMNMVAFLPEAKADEFDDEPPPVDVSKIIPAWNGVEWTCGRGAVFDYVMRACMVLNAAGQTSFSPAESAEEAPINCPAGTREVPHYRGGSTACIPNANWAIIPAERKSGIANRGFLSPKFLRGQSYEDQRGLVLGGMPAQDMAPVLPPSRSLGPAVVQNDDSEPGVAPAAPAAVVPGVLAIPSPADVAPATPVTAGAVELGTSVPPAAAKPETCEPPPQACKTLKDADKATAIGRWRSPENYQGADANVCISGGFASKYKGSTKSPGTCEIKRSIDLGGGKTTEPCKSDEALCNPALYCIGGKNAAGSFEPVTFCVKYKTAQGGDSGRPITDLCASTYAQKLEGKLPLLDCKVNPKLKGAAKKKAQDNCAAMTQVKAEACDPAYMPPDANFKKIWEDLIAGTQKLRDVWCGKLDFAALFCRECEIVNDKIYAMNKNATGTGCPEVKAPGVPSAPAAEPAPAAPAAEPEAVREQPRTDGR